MPDPPPRLRSALGTAFANAAAAILVFGAGQLRVVFSGPAEGFTALAPDSGVALAAFVLGGWQVGFGVLAGYLGGGFTSAAGTAAFPGVLALAVAGTVQAGLGAFLLHRFVGPLPPLAARRVLHSLLLLAPSAALAPAVRVVVSGLAAGSGLAARLDRLWLEWLGSFVGVLLVAPILVVAGRRHTWKALSDSLLWPVACALVGLALFSYSGARANRERELLASLRSDAREMAEAIRTTVERARLRVVALGAYFEASQKVERDEFRRFATALLATSRTTRAFAWAPRVPAGGRERFEEELRSAGLPGFEVFEIGPDGQRTPASGRAEHFPATYFEPFEANRVALGFDVASEARRAEAIARARDSGETTLSPPVRLFHDEGRERDFLMIQPVYRPGAKADTVAARRDALAGIAFAVIRSDLLVSRALGSTDAPDVDLTIFDVEGGRARFLAFWPSRTGVGTAPATLQASVGSGSGSAVRCTFHLDVLGRTWLVVARPGQVYASAIRGIGPSLRLVVGLAAAGAFLFFIGVRQRSEDRLLSAEAEYRALVEHSPAIVYLDEVGGRWRYISPKVEEILGYTPEDFLDRRVTWLGCVHEEDRERVSRETREGLREGTTIFLDYRMRTRDGRVVWIRDEAEPTRAPETGAWLLRGVMHDVTDRKLAEIELQALLEVMKGLASTSEPGEFLELVHAALRNVLSAESFCVFLKDPLTGLLEVLYSVGRRDDAPSAAGLGRGLPAWVLRSGEAKVVGPELFAELVHGGEVEADGSPAPSWLGAPLMKGSQPIGVMVVQDFDSPGRYTERNRAFLASVAAQVALAVERQRAVEAVRRSESRYRLVTENAGDVVWTLDAATGTFTFVSPSVKQMLGYSPDEVIGRRSLDFVPPESAARTRSEAAGWDLAPGHPPFVVEVEQVRKDGSVLLAEIKASAVLDESDRLQLVGVSRDVTERRRAEAERQALLEVMQGLASTPEPREFLGLVHEALRRVLYAENFFVLLHDPTTGFFESLYWVDQHDPDPTRLDMGRGCGAWVFRSGEATDMTPELFGELEARGEAEIVGTSSPSWLGAPLKKGGRSIGVMAVQDYETPGRYDERDRSFLASVAAQVALAIEREQVQEALRQSEARYRFVSENAADVIWTFDVASGCFTYFSPAAESLYGYAPGEIVGKPMDFLLTPADARKAAALVSARVRSGERPPEIGEFEHVRKDGTVFPTEVTSTWVVDAAGHLQIVGVTRDLTERKRSERESEALFRIVQGAVAATGAREFVAIVREALRPVLNAENLFVVLRNPRTGLLEELYKADQRDPDSYEPERLIRGRCAWVLRTGEAVVLTPGSFEELRARGEVEQVGTPPASWLGAPLGAGTKSIGVLAVQDYDVEGCYSERDRAFLASVAAQVALALERLRSREALLENEARLREAHRIAHVGVWELDPSAWTFTFSEEGCQILGLPPRDGLFERDEVFSMVHPEDREWVQKAVLDSLGSDAPSDVDHRLLLPDGRVRWVKGRWRPELGPDGLAVRVTGTVQDLTEQLLAREARALAEARDAAESANRAKSVFLASMSHEIRTPMNSILGFSQLLLGDPGLSARHQSQVRTIIRSGGHLLDLINDVLEMSRIEAGRTHVEESETDLFALLDDLESTFRLKVREKSLSFDIERPVDAPGHVLTDEKKLRQILMNLTGNAVKFTTKGYVKVRLRTEPEEGGKLRLLVDVEDSGPGISAEDQPRLFQRFEQTRVGREASTGTGLGLAISRAFARLMGGDVTVRSRLGEGSVFSLTLPVTAVAAPVTRRRVEARRVTGLPEAETRRRILVADDVEENREILRQMLARVGFEVRTAADGAEAVRLFSEWHPDLVLMDLRMPGTGGLEATRAIRANETSGRVPIVAVTASAFEDDRRDVDEAGGDGFVSKPFREDELLATVGRLLGLTYVFEGDADGTDHGAARAEALAIDGTLREALRAAVVAADLDAILGLADELDPSHPSAAATIRDLAERFEYDRLLAYLQEGDRHAG